MRALFAPLPEFGEGPGVGSAFGLELARLLEIDQREILLTVAGELHAHRLRDDRAALIVLVIKITKRHATLHEEQGVASCIAETTADRAEGVRSFLRKRPPRFRGK